MFSESPILYVEGNQIVALINSAQAEIDGSPAFNIPAALQLLVTAGVVFLEILMSLFSGVRIALYCSNGKQGDEAQAIFEFLGTFVQVMMLSGMLEFSHQILNSTYGDDYLDADYTRYIAQLAQEMHMHFHNDVSETVVPEAMKYVEDGGGDDNLDIVDTPLAGMGGRQITGGGASPIPSTEQRAGSPDQSGAPDEKSDGAWPNEIPTSQHLSVEATASNEDEPL